MKLKEIEANDLVLADVFYGFASEIQDSGWADKEAFERLLLRRLQKSCLDLTMFLTDYYALYCSIRNIGFFNDFDQANIDVDELSKIVFQRALGNFIARGKSFFLKFDFTKFCEKMLAIKGLSVRQSLLDLMELADNCYLNFGNNSSLMEKMGKYVHLFRALSKLDDQSFKDYCSILENDMKYIGSLFVEFESQLSGVNLSNKAQVDEMVLSEGTMRLKWISNFLLKIGTHFLGINNIDDYGKQIDFILGNGLSFWSEPSFFYKGILESKDIKQDIDNIDSIKKEFNTSTFLIFFREMQMIRVVLLSYTKRFDTKHRLFLDTLEKQIDFDQRFDQVLDILIDKCSYFDKYPIIESSTKSQLLYSLDMGESIEKYLGLTLVQKGMDSKYVFKRMRDTIDDIMTFLNAYGLDFAYFSSLNKIISTACDHGLIGDNVAAAYFKSTNNIVCDSNLFEVNKFEFIGRCWRGHQDTDLPDGTIIEDNGQFFVQTSKTNEEFLLNEEVVFKSTSSLIHEFGHFFFDNMLNDQERDYWVSSGWNFSGNDHNNVWLFDREEYVSNYACYSPYEDFAETFLYMITYPNHNSTRKYVDRFDSVMKSFRSRMSKRNNPYHSRSKANDSLFNNINNLLNDYLGTMFVRVQDLFEFKNMAIDFNTESQKSNDIYFSNTPSELTFDFRPLFIIRINNSLHLDKNEKIQMPKLLETCVSALILSYTRLYGIDAFNNLIMAYGYPSNQLVDIQVDNISKKITQEILSHKYIENNQKMFVNICRTLFDMFMEISFV